MTSYIDYQVRKNCWNLFDSYGEICVGCGCCSKDKTERYKARIATVKRWLKKWENFSMWSEDEELRALQERNIKHDIQWCKRRLRYYEKRLKESDNNETD